MISRLDRFVMLAGLIGAAVSFLDRPPATPAAEERRPLPFPAPELPPWMRTAPEPTPAPSPRARPSPWDQPSPPLTPSPPSELPPWLRPEPPPPAAEAPAPAPPAVVAAETEAPTKPSIGTAFSVRANGTWLTARHVAGECSQIAVQGPRGWVRARLLWSHAQADVSVIGTQGGTAPLPLSAANPTPGQEAFSFGFPQSVPGATYLTFLGRARFELRGHLKGIAPATVWAERRRWPEQDKSLGGISGGPVLDREGRVVGIHVAGSIRRGRVTAMAPEVIVESLLAAPIAWRSDPPAGQTGLRVTPDTAEGLIDTLKDRYIVVKVHCAPPGAPT